MEKSRPKSENRLSAEKRVKIANKYHNILYMYCDKVIYLALIIALVLLFIRHFKLIEGATNIAKITNADLMTKLKVIERKISGNSCLTKRDVKPQILKNPN